MSSWGTWIAGLGLRGQIYGIIYSVALNTQHYGNSHKGWGIQWENLKSLSEAERLMLEEGGTLVAWVLQHKNKRKGPYLSYLCKSWPWSWFIFIFYPTIWLDYIIVGNNFQSSLLSVSGTYLYYLQEVVISLLPLQFFCL